MSKPYVSAVIVAAGQGTRMKASTNKQYLMLKGKPILAHTLSVFEKSTLVDEVLVVVGEHEKSQCLQKVIKYYGYKKVKKLVTGGETRQQSMYNGLKEVNPRADIVITHDGARPLVHEYTIQTSIAETLIHKATVVGVPVKETIKIVDAKHFVENTPKRDVLWSVQTPQTFTYDLLMEAHQKALQEGFIGTDDGMLVERLGYPIKMIKGQYDNIKITTPEDLIIAESIINIRMR
ncbi:2-C-methyl-D-erythritol 4-phosphate cytidylyltransferase [Irregularibacter muris]|uniref:2-C-methyl-D-erythritol 4-phosphate cytidylyltransferase n=1 Tax=Irregularibacter muris TaxID=1796619 RepID=A0AAE3L2J7_9FIRM|nr:2-C-methyl-D-erythritol 4-phosphate cytidylyltransferase [Irregularibacter muris]MCR1898709.1 2-C-methyl-D-erythritol 4-phosphate cytidylyltransferase [Irregularibacter muris]